MSPANALERAAGQMTLIVDELAVVIDQQDKLRALHEKSERTKRWLTWATIALLVAAVLAFALMQAQAQNQRERSANRFTCQLELVGRWAEAGGVITQVSINQPDRPELLNAARAESFRRAQDMERVRELCP